MPEHWANLAPLILASALLPLQTAITLLLARNSLASAFAWVAGMTFIRVLQGVVFGFVFSAGAKHSGTDEPRFVLGGILLVIALLLFAKAFRGLLGAADEDAPPPAWLEKAGAMSPAAAFGAGAGFMCVGVKLFMFTLGATDAIEAARLGLARSILAFGIFVVLAAAAPLAILALSASSSKQSGALLTAFYDWLLRHRKTITILFGLVFGTWFLIKALKQLQVFAAAQR